MKVTAIRCISRATQIFLLLLVCFVVGSRNVFVVVHAQVTNNRLLTFLCQRRLLRRLEICGLINEPSVPSNTPSNQPTLSPSTQLDGHIQCNSNERIDNAFDLKVALERATNARFGPPTIIEICTEYIAIPPSYITSTNDGAEYDGDRFGFNISSNNIELKCNVLNSTIDSKGRCILDALDGTGFFYIANSTLLVNGFNMTNGGSAFQNAGGAIYLTDSSILNITDSAFTRNTAIKGGAIYAANDISM